MKSYMDVDAMYEKWEGYICKIRLIFKKKKEKGHQRNANDPTNKLYNEYEKGIRRDDWVIHIVRIFLLIDKQMNHVFGLSSPLSHPIFSPTKHQFFYLNIIKSTKKN